MLTDETLQPDTVSARQNALYNGCIDQSIFTQKGHCQCLCSGPSNYSKSFTEIEQIAKLMHVQTRGLNRR